MTGLIVIAAPSGAGKTTIIERLLKGNGNLGFSISATSRKPRAGEKHGENYYFMSPDEFRDRVNRGEFLEWEEVYEGSYYGSPKSEIQRIADRGQIALFDVDVMGALNIKKQYPNAFLIFILPPSMEILGERLSKRGTESRETLEKRLNKAKTEISKAPAFDYILLNDDLDEAVDEIQSVVAQFIDSRLVPGTFKVN